MTAGAKADSANAASLISTSAARPDAASHRVASFWSCSDLLQSRFPGARFTLAGASRTLSNAIRAFWHFGPPDNPQAVTGKSAQCDRLPIRVLTAIVVSTP